MSELAHPTAQASKLAKNYSALDRLLHRIAFAHPKMQRLLSDVENDLFRSKLLSTSVEHPVFITGLPRAGTTLLLELLYQTGEFASYTYRQMPFLLAPLLWNRITQNAKRTVSAMQRAHGDGMQISVDSPEAFEEVFWINHLSQQIIDEQCQHPLSEEHLSDHFIEAFRLQLKKVVALASQNQSHSERSTQSAARIGALRTLSPESTLLMCFRDPQTHVASLVNQHERFSLLHSEDRFAKQYMAWTAHHDFGANFLPIDFSTKRPGMPGERDYRYWLQYWIDAYRHVLDHAHEQVCFISYETLLEQPQASLQHLSTQLKLKTPDRLLQQSSRLRSGGSRMLDLTAIDPFLAEQAVQLHAQLIKRCLVSQSTTAA